MKTKQSINSNFINPLDKTLATDKKRKSLRPMRSMVAVRSLKPSTPVATLTVVRAEDSTPDREQK